MAKTATKAKAARDDRPPPPPAPVICDSCKRVIDIVSLTCGCFRG